MNDADKKTTGRMTIGSFWLVSFDYALDGALGVQVNDALDDALDDALN